MKKIILITLILVLVFSLFSGCIPQANAPEGSEQLAEQTMTQTPSPESIPEPLDEWELERRNLSEKFDFPIIPPSTQFNSYEKVIELLGDPDEETSWEIAPNSDYCYKHLFYSKYNRVFKVVDGSDSDVFLIYDTTFLYQTINEIKLGMTAKEVTKKLGDPSSKTMAKLAGDGDYICSTDWCQEWIYKDLGINLFMLSTIEDMSNATVKNITISKNSTIKLSSGIGIDSTQEEVVSKYCVGLYPDDYMSDACLKDYDFCDYYCILVGEDEFDIEVDCSARFYIEQEKVVGISIGCWQ